jgi:hypothetical protein
MPGYRKWKCKTKELLREVHRGEKSNIENAGEDGKAPVFGFSQVVFEGSKNPVRSQKPKVRRKRG